MKKAFDTKLRLNKANKQRLELINSILEEYSADGYVLTLRQLYYQLVARDIIPNHQTEYGKLGNILKKGRMAGIVDWNAIEDRVRRPQLPYWVHGQADAVDDMIKHYRLDRQFGQKHNIEVWVEKDALSNVLYRVTAKYGIRLMVNRGYSSCSAMYEAYRRLGNGDTILYFGDHDPSGLDMIRDVYDRLFEFGIDVNVIPVALNMEQIKKFNPPPNPTKIQDSRSPQYIEEFGYTCWELDALPPKELVKLVEDNIVSRIDMAMYNWRMEVERQDIRDLKNKFGQDEDVD